MGSRLALMACKGTHQTAWFPYKGDERKLEVSGHESGILMELVYETGRGIFNVSLDLGLNPFPQVHGIRRYCFSKQVLDGGPEVATSVRIITR